MLLKTVTLTLLIQVINSQYYNNGGSLKVREQRVQREPFVSWRQVKYRDQNRDAIVYERQPYLPHKRPSVNDDYVAYNNVPMGVSRWRNKLFITMPRRREGIPGTLNTLEFDDNMVLNSDLPLTPYPDLQTNTLPKGQRQHGSYSLVSVYRTTIDDCNRLWVIDNGNLEYPGNAQRVQPAAIVIFDLLTNQMIHRYELPSSVTTNASTLAAITVDVPNPSACERSFAYLPDVAGYGLIVYDLKEQRSWRFSHNYFHQDPNGGDFHINDLRFEWDDGIFSIALGPRTRHGFRTAYFHAMASTHEYAVDTRVLRNESMASESYMADNYIHLGDKGPNQQSAMSIIDQDTGVLFYSQVQIGGIACWNTAKPFSHVVLFQDNQKFVYPSDMTMDTEGNLWVMTNTMPYFIYRSLNPQETNFRIWKFNVKELIKNTNCE